MEGRVVDELEERLDGMMGDTRVGHGRNMEKRGVKWRQRIATKCYKDDQVCLWKVPEHNE